MSHPAQTTRLMLAAQRIGLHGALAEAATATDIDAGVASLARERVDAVLLFGDTFFAQHVREIAQAALKQRMASVFILREFVQAGGLMSYGARIVENFRRAATYVDKILKGASPADLPFEQPTTYELSINLRTAKALGLTIPPALLARADQVIE